MMSRMRPPAAMDTGMIMSVVEASATWSPAVRSKILFTLTLQPNTYINKYCHVASFHQSNKRYYMYNSKHAWILFHGQ